MKPHLYDHRVRYFEHLWFVSTLVGIVPLALACLLLATPWLLLERIGDS